MGLVANSERQDLRGGGRANRTGRSFSDKDEDSGPGSTVHRLRSGDAFGRAEWRTRSRCLSIRATASAAARRFIVSTLKA